MPKFKMPKLKMPNFIDTENFASWLSVPGGPSLEDKKFSYHLTAVSQPQSKFHGIKAIKILEYFTDNYAINPLGAQILAIQGFTDALREKRDDKMFTNKKSNEVDKYLKFLKKQIASFKPSETILTPFRQADIPITDISFDELCSKTGEEAYKCTICRLPFDIDIDNATPSAEPTPKEMQRIKALANKSLKAAKGNSGPEEDRVLQQLTSFATNLARLCVVPQNRHKTPKKETEPKDAKDLEKATDLKTLLAQIESYRCTEPILTECGHAFGTECLLHWVKEQGDDVKCPYCRKRLSRKAPKPQTRKIWDLGTNAGPFGSFFEFGTATNVIVAQNAPLATQSTQAAAHQGAVPAPLTDFTQSSPNDNGMFGPSHQGSSISQPIDIAQMLLGIPVTPHATHATPEDAELISQAIAVNDHQ